jgi:glycosyltransferase involved in cell wall biosynthesis
MAVVSTTVGAEGLPVRNGEDIVLADSPSEFAARTVALLEDRAARERLGSAARALVVEKYSWRTVAADLSATLDRVVSERRSLVAAQTAD